MLKIIQCFRWYVICNMFFSRGFAKFSYFCYFLINLLLNANLILQITVTVNIEKNYLPCHQGIFHTINGIMFNPAFRGLFYWLSLIYRRKNKSTKSQVGKYIYSIFTLYVFSLRTEEGVIVDK